MRYRRFALVFLVTSVCGFAQSGVQVSKPFPSTDFLKNLTIESFGYTSSPSSATGDEISPAANSAFYHLRGLECPICIGAPQNRVRPLLPPFGAKASLAVWHNRLILFAGFSGIDAVTGGNSPRISPLSMRANADTDAWVVQREIGASVTVDPERHLSVGISQSYLNDFGPSKAAWSATTGNLNFSPGLFKEALHGFKSAKKDAASVP